MQERISISECNNKAIVLTGTKLLLQAEIIRLLRFQYYVRYHTFITR